MKAYSPEAEKKVTSTIHGAFSDVVIEVRDGQATVTSRFGPVVPGNGHIKFARDAMEVVMARARSQIKAHPAWGHLPFVIHHAFVEASGLVIEEFVAYVPAFKQTNGSVAHSASSSGLLTHVNGGQTGER